MAENGPPKGPENTFKASHVESEGFQALLKVAVALAGSPTAASGVEKVRSIRPSGPGM